MPKAEISWKRQAQSGEKYQVNAHHVGRRWNFYIRQRRYERWEALVDPPLEDWLELLDAVRRLANRRRLRPEEIGRVEKTIRERFPDVEFQ